MEKVILPREVARAIERLKGFGDDADMVETHVKNPNGWVADPILNGLPLETFISALYIGYEIEKSPEDNLRDYFEKVKDDRRFSGIYPAQRFRDGKMEGIHATLNILGIKIEGVNS